MLLFLGKKKKEKKKEGFFNIWRRKIGLRFWIFFFLCLLVWNKTCKWTERVFETRKLTTLCWPCVYGVPETKRTKREKGKSFLFFCPFLLNELKQRMITFLLRCSTKLIHEDPKSNDIYKRNWTQISQRKTKSKIDNWN